MGRRSKKALVEDEIIERLSEGEPLRQICRDKHMPAFRRVYEWCEKDSIFSARFTRAREIGFDAIAEDCLVIANTPQEGVTTVEKDGEIERRKGDMVQHRKLQIHTRLQLLAKWSPKYADKSAVELTGKGGGPIEISDTERQAKLNAILAKAEKRRDASSN